MGGSCHNCGTTVKGRYAFCYDCKDEIDNYITKTEAKKKYLMKDDEFKDFPYFSVENRYKVEGRYYLIDDIEGFANIYHPEWFNKQNELSIKREKKKNTTETRQQNIDQIQIDYPDIYKYVQHILETYVSNGKISNIENQKFSSIVLFRTFLDLVLERYNGIKKHLKHVWRMFIQETLDYIIYERIDKTKFLLLVKDCNHRFKEIKKLKALYPGIERYVHNFVNNYINNGSLRSDCQEFDSIETFYKNVFYRHERLTKRLEKFNLIIREDSKLCNAYIMKGIEEAQKYVESIKSSKDIAEIMCEMDILYSKTSYKSIVDNEIRSMKKEYQRSFGEYMIDEDDVIEIRENSKGVALRNYYKNHKSKVPDFIVKKYHLH